MKLLTILTLVTTCSANELGLQQFGQHQYPFPLQFQPPQQASPFVGDSNVYLPPDTHTALPYFAQKNTADLQYQYLPPTGTKAPSKYPPPFPMFSTTFRPNSEEDDDDEEDDDEREVVASSPVSPFDRNRFNQSQNSPGPQVEIPNRPIPKTISYYPIDRIDTKYPAPNVQSSPMNTGAPPLNYQMPMDRRMIQPAGFMGNPNQHDQITDQMKTGSHPGHHYLPAPQGYSGPTPEPVPILRLSNEMDLDGSYSYEALSGDQTHMMQHGHVENLGTDHAENVVEGSYSYVGDNGQTYTVHYIADGNGFRASGDHLPVPPPVPEIIQRSIDYNIAEEKSKPAHLQNSYHEDDKNNSPVRTHQYQPTLPPQPPRNLFTGRQPEAFSHNHSGVSSSQNNNLQHAASTQAPIISHYEAPKEPPPRMATPPITPQITFLASQGAHDPSQSIKRMYSPPNYEAPIFRFGNLKNKFEQAKSDYQRSPWQYQNPFLHESVTKIPPAKNYISRSSLEQGDDVMINFSEMTPEQYSSMYHSQIKPKDNLYDEYEGEKAEHNKQLNNLQDNTEPQHYEKKQLLRQIPYNFQQNQMGQYGKNLQQISFQDPQNWYHNINQNVAQQTSYDSNLQSRAIDNNDQRSSLITKDAFIPQSQTVTNSYDTYKSDAHDARQIEFNRDKTNQPQYERVSSTTSRNNENDGNDDIFNSTYFEIYKSTTTPPLATEPEFSKIYQSPSLPSTTQSNVQKIQRESNSQTEITSKLNDSFNKQEPYSVRYEPETSKVSQKSTLTDENFNEVLKTNIFLKNAINKKSDDVPNNTVLKTDENWRPSLVQSQPKITEEKQENSENKMFHSKSKTANDFDETKRKSIDISQIANLVTLKNYFESNKIKPRQKQGPNSGTVRLSPESNYFSRNKQHENHYQNIKAQKSPTFLSKENSSYKTHKTGDFTANSYSGKFEDFDRMMGVEKIYKTLQRNSKLDGSGNQQLRSELMPPIQDYASLSLHKAQSGLPPLGRAGPSMKSYLPPIFS